MKSVISLFLLLTMKVSSIQAQLKSAAFSDTERIQFIERLMESYCIINVTSWEVPPIQKLVNSESQLLRFYPSLGLDDVADYDYDKNITDYLYFPEYPGYNGLFYIFNSKHGKVDTLIGIIEPSTTDSCFHLSESYNISPVFFKKLKPIIAKVDFTKASIFTLPVEDGDNVYLLIDGNVFVVDGENLVPFNTYFKPRYSVGRIRKMLDGVPIR